MREEFHHFRTLLSSVHSHTVTYSYLQTPKNPFTGTVTKTGMASETVPTASRTFLQKRKEKLQNIKTSGGEGTYLSTLILVTRTLVWLISRFLTIGIGK